MTRVKVCGVTSREEARTVAGAGADALGVIADVPVDTHREVDAERAGEIVDAAPPFLSTTLVTMPDDVDSAVSLVDRVGADHLQIHGVTDPEAIEQVRSATPARLVAAVDASEPAVVRSVAPHADAVLVDSTTDSGAGGTGETHDWARTRDLAADLDVPVVLAGGLTPRNVGTAVRTVEPYAVDVASGVEDASGATDPTAVERFVATARRAGGEVLA